jgi:hypothetical protein
MSKVINLREIGCFYLPAPDKFSKRNRHGLSTADFRRILSDLKLRAPSERAFLRKLLTRALATGGPTQFPAVTHVVVDPAGSS